MSAEITAEDRHRLSAHLARTIFDFFRNQQEVHTLAGNRLAAEKTKLVAGRVAAAVTHDGPLDGGYLMLSRRMEVQTADSMDRAVEIGTREGIRPV